MLLPKAGYNWERSVSSSGFLCRQWREKNSSERNWEALNFSIRLWTAPRRSICITDPGEAHLPRQRLVCVNPLSFSWLPITLCIGNTATERGSGFIQGTPKWNRDKAALTPRDTGTERVNGNRMKPKGKGGYAKFSYFTGRKYILNLSSTHVRAFRAAVTSRQLTQPAVVHHRASSTQCGSWQVSHSYQRPQALAPNTLWGCFLVCFPLQKYFLKSYSVGGGCLDVELLYPRFSGCPSISGCGSDPPNFCACAKTEGDCSRVVSSKILVSHRRSMTFHNHREGLRHM